jgi:hypothetical protein
VSSTFADWLALREPADAAARAAELIGPLRRHLDTGTPIVIHDLGAGTGSMGRWLAPRLPERQHWVLYDRDQDLLAKAGGGPVSVATRQRDITRLTAADLDGAALVTASALLDMFTAPEVERVVAACAGAGCPALLTISVTGRVELSPADPLDTEIMAAFNDHQRRTVGGRRLLGPDAADVAVAAFRRRGIPLTAKPSPWRLGARDADLIAAWLDGWVGAACEQRPELASPAAEYAGRRRKEAFAGQLSVVVHHTDVLANCR